MTVNVEFLLFLASLLPFHVLFDADAVSTLFPVFVAFFLTLLFNVCNVYRISHTRRDHGAFGSCNLWVSRLRRCDS